MNSTKDHTSSNDSIPETKLPPDHPLYIDPTKKLTRFDLILMNNYKSIESYSSPYSTSDTTTRSSTHTSTNTSTKSLNDIDKNSSSSSAASITSNASTSKILPIPNITTTRCSTEDDHDDAIIDEVNDEDDEGASLSLSSDDENSPYHHPHHGYHTPQQYSMERSFSDFGSLSTIPEVPTPITPASNVDNISLGKFGAEKQDSFEVSFDNNEERKLSTSSMENNRSITESPPSKYNTVTLGGRNKLNKQITLGAPNTKTHAIGGSADGTLESTATVTGATLSATTTNHHHHLLHSRNGMLINGNNNGGGGATVTGASSLAHEFGIKKSSRTPLFRRHSTFQSRPEPECEMDTLLFQSAGDDAMQIAFARSKTWSRYCQLIISFYNQRLRLENEHAQKLQKLTEQTRNALSTELKNNNYLPLFPLFNEILDATDDFSIQAETTAKSLNERVVKLLQQKHDDHENCRRQLKSDYAKHEKAFTMCNSDLKKAQRNMENSQSSYFKARDTTSRTQHAVQTAGVLGPDHNRKMKDIEKKKIHEENALQKKNDAECQVRHLSMKRDIMQKNLNDLWNKNVSQLCEGIIACDRATQVSTSRFLESFSSFITPQPSKYQELADAARSYRPGSEFMSFLQNLPGRSISSSSLLRENNHHSNGGGGGGISLNTTTTDDDNAASTSTGGRSSTTSTQSSIARSRRNALNEAEHYDLIVETQQHRKPKISMGRLFDPSSSASTEYTEPTRSHKLVRTRQVIKCVQCDRVSLLTETVKCTACGISWHKKCLANNAVVCGPNAKPFAESARRVSIFGVPLKSHLELQKRKVPQILEKCIDEIQRKGMRTKGLYRTCGLKSKVEQICQTFEQSDGSTDIKLDDNNITAMNVASVIKLYLRKLPEPLLSFELYSEFLHFDTEADTTQIITRLQDLIATKLPEQNYETLKFLILHLKRVTWFQKDNLMPAANVAAVITPSLIWAPMPQTPGVSTPASATSGYQSSCGSFVNDAHQQSKVIELLIKNAFEIFEIDSKADWRDYFERYPKVKEPEQMDSDNVEEIVTNDEPGLEDEDCLEEDDYDDELDQVACSSSNISQQPPTPDLLRNTNNNNRKNIQSSADDLITVEPEQGYNRKYIPAVRTVSAGYHPSTITNFKQQRSNTESSSGDDGGSNGGGGGNGEGGGFSKQRSFTTSILVSPQNNRKIFLPQQRSIEEQSSSTAKGYSSSSSPSKISEVVVPDNSSSSSQTILQSGEVTIDIKKDQFFLPSPSSEVTLTHTRAASNSSNPNRLPPVPKTSSTSTTSSNQQQQSQQREQLYLNGLGLILSPSTDVSYV